MSAAADAFKINLDQYGVTVSYQPRAGSAISVKGIFSQAAMTPLKDDREGRSNMNVASLLILNTDIDGNAFTVDDQSEFVVDDGKWAVSNAATIDGGYLVSLKQVDRKTVKRVPGNS